MGAAWPLMSNNITRDDLAAVIRFLSASEAPILTQSKQVEAFEREWSAWLGVRHSVFVNSGASANLITMAALRHRFGPGEVIVPTLTWVSDVASVLHAGLVPVFVDIDPRTLGMDADEVIAKLSPRTRAVFLTHVLGYDALSDRLLDALRERRIPLVEDVCESHGATHAGRKLGTFGWASNFSFYYAHHMSTIEGGMVCTDDAELFGVLRMLRSHGMTREIGADAERRRWSDAHPDLTPDFIFALPGFNVRSTEINAVIGRSQLRRLDANNARRRENLALFLKLLDPAKYFTEFHVEGSCNYAFTLVLRKPDERLLSRVVAALREHGVEFRRGTSGGGNQLRQPYLQDLVDRADLARFPRVDHIHFFGFYIGNYPDLEPDRIRWLCDMLNGLSSGD
ncbi:MAG: CDP-4-keto-6-deoxy-D-glucose-3-dehydrase [Proteobacteria bacterium]|nr:MAG: CDP-4-keto-6-deoxy-D-glucose-3-dehydrase [Pseudomonadota bacterium]